METLMIRDEGSRLVPMTFSESQEILWKHVAPQLDSSGRLWFIVLKGRQTYSTTFWENLLFVRTMEKPNTRSLVLAHDLYSSADIFGMAKRFYEHLPLPQLKPAKVKELEFAFPEGSSILRVVSAGNMAKGRGTTQTCVHASEVAFWPHPEVMIGLFQAIPDLDDTMWVMESTANGMVGIGNAFYEEWKAAVDGRSKLEPIFLPWFLMRKYREQYPIPSSDWDDEEKILVEQFGDSGLDGHALAWRRSVIETKLQGSLEMFHQEYPSTPEEAFVSSGLPAFEARALLGQQRNIKEPIKIGSMIEGNKFLAGSKGWISVWREPQDGHMYAIGVDTAAGIKGGDYACGQIVDMETLEQVAIIHGFITPWDFAQQLNWLGRWYNTGVLAIELQNTGRAVQDYLIRVFNYPNLHVWRGRQADQIRPTPVKLYGWETNVQSRPLLIESGRRAINTGLVIIHDRSTLDEISKFSRSDAGKYEAEIGHDDRVIALLIALRSREENYAPASRAVINTEYSLSDENFQGIRVIHAADGPFQMRRKVHQQLNKRVGNALKHWMEM